MGSPPNNNENVREKNPPIPELIIIEQCAVDGPKEDDGKCSSSGGKSSNEASTLADSLHVMKEEAILPATEWASQMDFSELTCPSDNNEEENFCGMSREEALEFLFGNDDGGYGDFVFEDKVHKSEKDESELGKGGTTGGG